VNGIARLIATTAAETAVQLTFDPNGTRDFHPRGDKDVACETFAYMT
jgi:hypothetical protein